jgi:hypothetical protein
MMEAYPAAQLSMFRPEMSKRLSTVDVIIPGYNYARYLRSYGYTGETLFHEDACTVEVNAHGGLISMQTALRPGQKLLVVNKETKPRSRASSDP